MVQILYFCPSLTPEFYFRENLTTMKRIESIADYNAELFIKKHFSNLSDRDRMVKVMRNSVRDTIKKALEAYDVSTVNNKAVF